MKRLDHRIIFTALGFMAVVLSDLPQDKQALRATSIARLIESFCMTSLPEAFAGEYLEFADRATETERVLERYIAELRDEGSALMTFDRQTLFKMYELLLIQKIREEQSEFYASGDDEIIAKRVLQLVEEKIHREAQQ